jgi:hypothetical protein
MYCSQVIFVISTVTCAWAAGPQLRKTKAPTNRTHGHHQYLVEVLQDFLEDGGRRCRIDGDPDTFP